MSHSHSVNVARHCIVILMRYCVQVAWTQFKGAAHNLEKHITSSVVYAQRGNVNGRPLPLRIERCFFLNDIEYVYSFASFGLNEANSGLFIFMWTVYISYILIFCYAFFLLEYVSVRR